VPAGAGSWNAYLVVKEPEVPLPLNLAEAERQEWLHRWRFTEAGAAYRHARRGFGHELDVGPDGSFGVEEIQPGAYELRIHRGFRDALKRQFVVPEPASKANSAVVDLGTITLENAGPASTGR
jgi:hypothetical protein